MSLFYYLPACDLASLMSRTGSFMATALHQTAPRSQAKRFIERWFFTGMALVMLLTVVGAFMPSIAYSAGRRAPLSLLAAAHGIVFFAWVLIFLAQSLLVATRHFWWHKRLGIASMFIFALMIPLGYETTIVMVRRGFDLSGDLGIEIAHDPAHDAVFPLFNILIFSALVITALAYRRHPEIHKRLMLFANIELDARSAGAPHWPPSLACSSSSGDRHGSDHDLRNCRGREGFTGSAADSSAYLGTGNSADGVWFRGGGANRIERGMASLCGLARAVVEDLFIAE